MMASVHVWLGAAAGVRCPGRVAAFAAGAASHAAGDMIPHREGPPTADTVLTIASLIYLGSRFGYGSPAFMGGLGGLAPDLEHIAGRAVPAYRRRKIFPTHNRKLKHGRSDSYLSQALCGALSLAAFAFLAPRPRLDARRPLRAVRSPAAAISR